MLKDIQESYITKYSCPMVAYIANDRFDEESGDVESSTGWFARAGKWIIGENSSGFVDGFKYSTVAEASEEFDRLSLAYNYPDRICVDCAMVWANGDTSGMTSERAAEVIAAAGVPEGGNVIVGDESGFSWWACDACNSPLGGDRFYASIVED